MQAMLRGIERTAIFVTDSDSRIFLAALADLTAARSLRVQTSILVTHHGHLRMTPASERGSRLLMKGLGQRCVQRVNGTFGPTRTLVEGRFRSSIVEADTCLLACRRHIELNPVRAGTVQAVPVCSAIG